ncbi:YeeE/YedE thiosulfate transporter family protein [Methyloversatilis sp.]|uniref:YeeE/YedE thiosulfate transporter family protein n=1 Tax=Methyloversatilis sp. TaxID=2569862 RepID=UPI002737425B|nr:YeeE/YedE thiosulfate transporter family protein [Methyloversatilis sp.]MDP2867562.1 YeeE/YedE thiosulfate transporter family protein [Methyloversatilis sp.]MDP3456017.1 YeeE/YedE thiosulfate transporter family protein [Methyloversatilis sp.]MDP3579769.1 YeeE/YedE thiosulfate transporter family protein [Methyloversatilis sp.]
MTTPENVPPVLIIPLRAGEQQDMEAPGKPDSARQLVLALVFGIAFGFLLQKGGVARYEVLMGQFFLTDFTVIKVMLTAIIVGMLGIFSLRALGLVELHVKPTHYAANIVGGLLFGVGLGLLGYCPGTGVAALGQGNCDAIAGIIGLMAGSYLYAETSGYVASTIQKIGSRGEITLPELLGIRLSIFLAAFVPALVLALFALARLAP